MTGQRWMLLSNCKLCLLKHRRVHLLGFWLIYPIFNLLSSKLFEIGFLPWWSRDHIECIENLWIAHNLSLKCLKPILINIFNGLVFIKFTLVNCLESGINKIRFLLPSVRFHFTISWSLDHLVFLDSIWTKNRLFRVKYF